jgi:hypothetical protein
MALEGGGAGEVRRRRRRKRRGRRRWRRRRRRRRRRGAERRGEERRGEEGAHLGSHELPREGAVLYEGHLLGRLRLLNEVPIGGGGGG